MKAKIHFTEKEVYIHIEQTALDVINSPNTKLTQSFSELQKLLLLAVIEKEAEKFSKLNYAKAPKQSQEDADYIQAVSANSIVEYFRNSLIERLPSEDWLNKIQPDFDRKESYLHGFHDAIEVVKDNVKKLLLPLPSSANCECEEVNGKITVKKIWI